LVSLDLGVISPQRRGECRGHHLKKAEEGYAGERWKRGVREDAGADVESNDKVTRLAGIDMEASGHRGQFPKIAKRKRIWQRSRRSMMPGQTQKASTKWSKEKQKLSWRKSWNSDMTSSCHLILLCSKHYTTMDEVLRIE
jgi:hypothetical protein